MGLFFACPNCSKAVDPMTANAVMHPTTKQWQHIDCTLPQPRPSKRSSSPQPSKDRRRKPRGKR